MSDSLDKLLAELVVSGAQERAPDPSSARERIVQAALAIFAEQSYEAATTKAIARRAGVTERTLFKHFPSKEQLFAQTVFPAMLKALAPVTLQPALATLEMHAGDFEAALRVFVAGRVAFALEHPALITMLVRELLVRPTFRTAVASFFSQRAQPYLEQLIVRARDSGQIRDLPADVVMRAIVGQLGAYLLQRVLFAPQGAWDAEEEVAQIVGLIMQGIGPTERPG
jgi:TetR/AcrR family transcriptional regulator